MGAILNRRSEAGACWLCGRDLGRRVEWHHPVPKSRGGRAVEPVHPICHRAIHASFGNAELARFHGDPAALRAHPAVARFLAWIADKPPDFHAPTHRRR
ncbi:MAG: HNH endonuclease [Sphingobium sp.]|uniref:HNH endonuclease n=1 Tax=Sphingobium sp. TaxID=1912891 RepID=UPI000DB4D7A3|nr:HNH endonuclease [Sphingobium sp.]PZU14539.1 MAG: HNH endonuclease [Sphingobium sp.]